MGWFSRKQLFLGAVLLLFGYVALIHVSCSNKQSSELLSMYADSLPDKIDYNIHVRPILSDKCFNCHGPDANKREAGLRLDTPEGAFSLIGERKDHAALSKGDLSCEVAKRITTTDKRLQMPTPASNLNLSAFEKAVLLKWIDEGAEYKPLWSYIPVVNYEAPELSNDTWSKNEIDRFILKKLLSQKLSPSAEADKTLLLRRVSLDLTGLPPTEQEIASFIADKDSNAYEKVVDRLLASPHFGEKMAYDWMDVARYADSHGYQDDGYRNSFHWRNYVIESFNKNKSYNMFTIEQIAGDLLPNATKEQLIASGFNRNHAQNQEGGIVDEEFRVEYVLDRVNTVGKAYLGLTVECARCHDHKYDPFTRANYYEMSAFFNKGHEAGWIANYALPGPTIINFTKQELQDLEALKKKIQAKQSELGVYKKQHLADYQNFKKSRTGVDQSLVTHYPLNGYSKVLITKDEMNWAKMLKYTNTYKGDGEVNAVNPKFSIEINKDSKVIEGKVGKALELVRDRPMFMHQNQGIFNRYDDFSILFWLKPTLHNPSGQVIFSRAKSIYDGNSGYELILESDSTLLLTLISRFRDNMIEVKTKEKISYQKWNFIAITYDGSSKASGVKIYLNGSLTNVNVNVDGLTKGFNQHIAYGKKYAPFISDGKGNLDLISFVNFEIGAQETNYKYPSISKAGYDEFRIYERALAADEVAAYYNLKNPITETSLSESSLQNCYFEGFDTTYRALKADLKRLLYKKDSIETQAEEIMVSGDGNKRKTYMLNRGAYDALGDTVTAKTPDNILPFDAVKYPKNRLGLAQWLVDAKNPLTPRVTVNRYWQMLFGQGLVVSSGDFGNQGTLPTHPELLDYLASDFVKSNWNLKALLKKMVMSATYRQTSKTTPELIQKDPQNLLYARGPRFRLTFELIRDQLLAASGLLNDTIGGPSVFPYQPANIWEEKTSGRMLTKYPQSHGSNLYKRTLYTFFKRTAPNPALMTFDASDRSYCNVKRGNTNTPLQALVLLNDPQLLEAARVLASKCIDTHFNNTTNQITFAYLRILGRAPKPKEVERLQALYNSELRRFESKPKEASKFLSYGEFPIKQHYNPFQLAALSVVIHTIMNLDEAINKS